MDLKFPGVYIEESAAENRRIEAAPTAVTAFAGSALRGVVNSPVMISSYKEYETLFGGTWLRSAMSYSVSDFFLHGGKQAIILRLISQATESMFELPLTDLSGNKLMIHAKDPGSWSAAIKLSVSHDQLDNEQSETKFNLLVIYNEVIMEEFRNVSILEEDPHFIAGILNKNSRYLQIKTHSAISREHRPAVGTDIKIVKSGSDGEELAAKDYIGDGVSTGIYHFLKVDLFNLLCIPVMYEMNTEFYNHALKLAVKKRAMFIMDSPPSWSDGVNAAIYGSSVLSLPHKDTRNLVLYFPWIIRKGQANANDEKLFPPSGIIAGIIAKTDETQGVWKSPAGNHAKLKNISETAIALNDNDTGNLSLAGINSIRKFPGTGCVLWGARTFASNAGQDEYKYISVRRIALFLEESIYRGISWAVFEPNAEPLWKKLISITESFLFLLFRDGALQGRKPEEAYFVKCDGSTNTITDIQQGRLNLLIGFAPLRPAEFLLLSFTIKSRPPDP